MKIQSNFKDYYDFIQQYGVDERIFFDRVDDSHCKFNGNEVSLPKAIDIPKNVTVSLGEIASQSYTNKQDNLIANALYNMFCNFQQRLNFNLSLHHFIVSINGKIENSLCIAQNNYFIGRNMSFEDVFNVFTQYVKENNLLPKHLNAFRYTRTYETFEELKNDKPIFYRADKKINKEKILLELHKEIKNPILFMYSSSYGNGLSLYKNIPLNYIGINNALGSVEALTQEISYCLGNVINNNNEPPVQVDNKTKIEQHGFDYKKSFRHRK